MVAFSVDLTGMNMYCPSCGREIDIPCEFFALPCTIVRTCPWCDCVFSIRVEDEDQP